MKTIPFIARKSPLVVARLAALCFLLSPAVRATDTLSSTAAATAIWGTNSNWLDNTFPVSTDDVVIDYSNQTTPTTTVVGLNGAQAANSLTFGSATGTALGDFTLRANTSGTTARTLTLSSLSAITIDSSVTGTINLGTPSSTGFGVLTVSLPTTGTTTFSVATGTTLNVAATLSGTGTILTLSGGGTVILAGSNNFGASARLITTSSTGTLVLNNAAALGNALNILNINGTSGSKIDNTSGGAIVMNNTNGIRVSSNFTFVGTNDLTFNGAIDLRSGTRTITTTAGTLTLNGAVSSGTGLTKAGAGTLVLGGAGSYTGTTTINSGGSLQLGTGGTTGSLLTTGTIVNNGNLTINRSNGVVQGTDFSASAISGTGSFTQTGAGTTTLNVANTYSGLTTVNAGTLNLGIANAVKNSATNAIVLGGGTLQSDFSQNLNLATLSLTAGTASTLDLSTGGTFVFADSHSATWGSGSTLSIVGTFTSTSVRFGTSGGGLTSGQLADITINGSAATIDSSGFLATAVPEPSTFAILLGVAVLGLGAHRRRRAS